MINLGQSSTILLHYLVKSLEKFLDKKAIINWVQNHPGDMYVTCANISKATQILGYKPQFPFEKGLQLYVEWQKLQEKDCSKKGIHSK